MSRLFIGLYLDEDVDVLAADWLRSRGFKVTTIAVLPGSDPENRPRPLFRPLFTCAPSWE
jgi:hypothetical protein